jgi:hypothetical protein
VFRAYNCGMERRTSNDEHDPATIPEWERRTGIGHRKIRAAVRAGVLPAYDAGSTWPRIFREDLIAWVRSTRVPIAGGPQERGESRDLGSQQ